MLLLVLDSFFAECSMTMAQSLQIIDISPFVTQSQRPMEAANHLNLCHVFEELSASQSRVIHEVRQAFETTGFLLIKNHGVPLSIPSAIQVAASAFFSNPDDIKKQCFVNRAQAYHKHIGWHQDKKLVQIVGTCFRTT